MQHVSSPRDRDTFTRNLRLGVCLLAAGCSADATTTKPALDGAASGAERSGLEGSMTSANASARGASDGGVATRGAGMPNVPIHRADADAGSTMQRDAATDMPTTQPPVRVGARDAGADAAQVNEPAPDAGAAMMLETAVPLPRPLHRYSFSGAGVAVHDELSGPDAILQGDAQLDGNGSVTLPEDGDGVVKLPDGFLNDVTDFTALVWLEARSQECWQRALDFGYVQPPSTSAPGTSGPAGPPQITSLYLTPFGCPDALPTLGYTNNNAKYHLISKTQITQSVPVQLGLSFAARSQTLRLIVNGVVESEQAVAVDVRALQRAQLWLGQSHFNDDPPLHGAITELRIYASTLDASALKQLFQRGPDDSP